MVQKIGESSNRFFCVLQDWNEILKDIPMDNYPQP